MLVIARLILSEKNRMVILLVAVTVGLIIGSFRSGSMGITMEFKVFP